MSQRGGIPANLVSKAMKMMDDGASTAHVAQWARCPVDTIQSLWDDRNKPSEPEAKPKAKPKAKKEPEAEQPTEENTAPDTA
ncbi:unnamed protein product [marine sediment metagenome]|uniref:Uncharacterized protein n=1 Tax=marine sediment metagenome TaxID=412755 RepID=X0YQN1_9ZZZZ